MKKKTIILSYDYELFFGLKSGTVYKSIVEPTNKLMDIMERNGLRGNFFVDYLMFRELEKQHNERAQKDLALLKDQIRDMVHRGHRIELHLHPHWIDAKYNGDGTWNFDDFTHYSLSSLSEDFIIELFKSGTNYLTSLAREVDNDYKIVAFRAGGWAVQPFDKLKRAFLESGIIIDSSTSQGCFNINQDSYYDFRNMPQKAVYHFDNDVCKEVKDGRFLEVPITSFHRNLFLVLYDRIYGGKFCNFKKKTDGTHNRQSLEVSENKKGFLDRITSKHKLMFSFSMQSPLTVKWALRSCNAKLCCYIDHPKDFSNATEKGIDALGKYCNSTNYISLL